MCGIFGAVSGGSVAKTVSALKLLEYRGYDSAGIAVKRGDLIEITKVAGRVSALEEKVKTFSEADITIGHTRWATHGKVSEENAHPFYSQDKTFAVVHNGIIENYAEIKDFLQGKGFVFHSETDSETIVHLLQYEYDGDIMPALLKTAKLLEGAYAAAIASARENALYALKNKSPLVAAAGADGFFLCSDIRTAAHFAEKFAVIPDKSVVAVCSDGIRCFGYDGVERRLEYVAADCAEQAEIYDGDLMLKEIYEIPDKLRAAKDGYFASGGIGLPRRKLAKIKRIYLLGCGTAYNSGLAAAVVMRRLLDIDVAAVLASEFIYDRYPVDAQTLSIVITQSGETADTVRAAEKVKQQGGFTYAVTNAPNSSICFVADKIKFVNAGGEFAVASTKAYNCQLAVLILMALDIAEAQNTLSAQSRQKYIEAMDRLPSAAEQALSCGPEIASLAAKLKNTSAVFFIGRKGDYPTAVEGSLKLKEISYIHSEAYAAGELKHGTLALVEKGVTVIALATDADMLHKMNAAVSEVSSRGGEVVIISPYGKDKISSEARYFIGVPVVNNLLYGIVSVIPLQLTAYYFAKELKRNIDKPRNLAKSVTVE